jgi:hypothetical protein
MRSIVAVIAVLALAGGCRRQNPDFYNTYDAEEEAVGEYDPSLMVDPAFYENVKTSELGTELIRGTAKTVDWSFGSIDEGATYLGGFLRVDKVFRQDADDFFKVTIRLRNTDASPAKIEWKIALFDANGTRMSGLTDWVGDKEVWRSASIEPRSSVLVNNGSRIKGATVFRLHVRRAGASDDGMPDAAKEKGALDFDAERRKLLGDE